MFVKMTQQYHVLSPSTYVKMLQLPLLPLYAYYKHYMHAAFAFSSTAKHSYAVQLCEDAEGYIHANMYLLRSQTSTSVNMHQQ
jgi:hypothetical protein